MSQDNVVHLPCETVGQLNVLKGFLFIKFNVYAFHVLCSSDQHWERAVDVITHDVDARRLHNFHDTQ